MVIDATFKNLVKIFLKGSLSGFLGAVSSMYTWSNPGTTPHTITPTNGTETAPGNPGHKGSPSGSSENSISKLSKGS